MSRKTASLAAALVLAGALAASRSAAAGELTLAQAVRNDDVAAVEGLLKEGASPNAPLPDTSTVLDWAVVHQNREMVRLLLAGGADPNSADADGMTPLLFACQFTDAEIVRMLLDARADVRAARPDGISALALCARNSSPAIVERMVAAGAPFDAADQNGQTPLMWAAAGGNLDTIRLLVKHGANVNAATRKGFTPLFFAVKGSSPNAPEAILDAGGDLNHVAADGTTALMLAVYQKDFDVAAMLANRGAELNRWDENGEQPLHVAARENQAELAKVLIAKGADVNAVSKPPRPNWQTEPNAGRLPIPKFVGVTPLLSAAQKGNADLMKLLVAAGAKTDFKGDDGTNVVLAAAIGGGVEALDYALQLQPDLSVANDAGLTALHLVLFNRPAQVRGHLSPETPQMVRLLAAKGASLTAKNNRGQTPFDSARRAPPEVFAAFEEAMKNRGLQLSAIEASEP